MATWILVTLVVFVAGTAVIAVLFSEDSPVRHPGLKGEPRQPIRPADLRSVAFRTTFRGYDPAMVDKWLVAAADAWDVLAETAGEDLIAHAEERLVSDAQTHQGTDGDDAIDALAWLEAELPPGVVSEDEVD